MKAQVARRGEGVFKVSPPLPPLENFNYTHGHKIRTVDLAGAEMCSPNCFSNFCRWELCQWQAKYLSGNYGFSHCL